MKAIETRLKIVNAERFGNVRRIVAESDAMLPQMAAGQFAHIKVPTKDLRRPICVYYSTDRQVTFIIADAGEGTKAFNALGIGASFDATLPLGNGFPVLPDKTNIVLLGGGTGCAPLYKIAADNKSLNCTALLGFPTKASSEMYKGDFDRVCRTVCYCTDDGSLGYHGFPTDLLTELAPEVLYVCGASGMVRAAREYCKKLGVIGFASAEQHMGCGVGACLVCSVRVMRDGKERLLRACADGPVFSLDELVL